MRIGSRQGHTSQAAADVPRRRPRPGYPEDFGRGVWWRLGDALLLGVVLPSPPRMRRMLPREDEQDA